MDERQAILNDLYGLRAGLSVISIWNDAVDDGYGKYVAAYCESFDVFKDDIVKLNLSPAPCDGYRQTIGLYGAISEWILSGEAEKYFSRAYDEEYNRDLKKLKDDLEKAKKRYKSDAALFYCTLPITIPLCLTMFGIFGIVMTANLYKDGKSEYKEAKRKYEALVNGAPSKSQEFGFYVSDFNENRARYRDFLAGLPEAKRQAASFMNGLNSEYLPRVSQINRSTLQLYNALYRQYSPILDERDWQHLDLITFYIETRRADNIKEALLLVDKEIQTQRIENAIYAATQEICRVLKSGFAAVQSTISYYCANISAQIAATNESLNALGSTMLQSQNVNSALLAKANETSVRLMQDVGDIKQKLTDMQYAR